MKPCALVLALCLSAAPLAAQSDRLEWLRRHSIPIASIDPGEEDVTDLEPLVELLAGVRVLQLAELSHGDGGGAAARVRLIRFLHQRLGFNVVVWEAGFHECHLMNDLLAAGAAVDRIMSACLWPFWRESAEITALFAYARDSWRTASPLRMAGFDLQFTGTMPEQSFRPLASWFERAKLPLPPELARILHGPVTRASRDSLIDSAPELLAHFERHATALHRVHGAREAARIERVLQNAAEYRAMLIDRDRSRSGGPDTLLAFVDAYNRRERVNAANLLWLTRHYRDARLIVWSHNVHAAHSRIAPDYGSLAAADAVPSLESAGRLLKLELGDALYSMGTIAYAGAWGFPGRVPVKIAEPEPGSLEQLLYSLGIPHLILDLRSAGHPEHWLRRPLPSSISAQVPGARYPVVWPATFDGLLFLQRMTPASARR